MPELFVDSPAPSQPRCPALKLRLGYFLSCLACIHLIGGHWAILQSVAWVGMLADYGRAHGAKRALEMTFDGNNPCSLCRAIKAKKADEEKQQDLPVEKLAKAVKIAPLLPGTTFQPPSRDIFSVEEWPALRVVAATRSHAPPRPVPRNGWI